MMTKDVLVRLRSSLVALAGFAAPLLFVLFAVFTATAQDGDPGTDRAETFVPVEGPQVEDVPGGPLMVAAYGLLWVLVFGYLFMLSKRARNLEARIEQLESKRGQK